MVFVHARRARLPSDGGVGAGGGGGASMQLCGLLRKTGAKIPAGPFRYGDGRQQSGHAGGPELQPHSHGSSRRLIRRSRSGGLLGSSLRETRWESPRQPKSGLTCAG